jgi:hypothetical protein
MSDKSEPLQVLHRDLSTACQINMLLSVSNSMAQFLTALTVKTEEWDKADTTPDWEEGYIAAENTLISACGRIDSIISDDRRWGLDFQARLERLFEKNTEIARAVSEKQKALIEETTAKEKAIREAAEAALAPHIQFRPTLFAMGDGTWVAYLGDPADLSSGILGNGESPVAALKSFDAVFNGALNEDQLRLVERLKNENEKLDISGTGATEEIGLGKQDGQGNVGSSEA